MELRERWNLWRRIQRDIKKSTVCDYRPYVTASAPPPLCKPPPLLLASPALSWPLLHRPRCQLLLLLHLLAASSDGRAAADRPNRDRHLRQLARHRRAHHPARTCRTGRPSGIVSAVPALRPPRPPGPRPHRPPPPPFHRPGSGQKQAGQPRPRRACRALLADRTRPRTPGPARSC